MSATVGTGMRIKGELSSDGPLAIEGAVEGRIELDDHLTVRPEGSLHAEVHVKTISVEGRASGRISATERVEIKASGVVLGEIRGPVVIIEDGAALKGRIEMDLELPEEP